MLITLVYFGLGALFTVFGVLFLHDYTLAGDSFLVVLGTIFTFTGVAFMFYVFLDSMGALLRYLFGEKLTATIVSSENDESVCMQGIYAATIHCSLGNSDKLISIDTKCFDWYRFQDGNKVGLLLYKGEYYWNRFAKVTT